MPTSAPFVVTRAEPTIQKLNEFWWLGGKWNHFQHVVSYFKYRALDSWYVKQIANWLTFCWLSVNWRSTEIKCANLNIPINLAPKRLTKLHNTNVYESVSSKIKSFGHHLLLAALNDITFFVVLLICLLFSTGYKSRREKNWRRRRLNESKRLRTIECSALVDLVSFIQRIHLFVCVRQVNCVAKAVRTASATPSLCHGAKLQCFGDKWINCSHTSTVVATHSHSYTRDTHSATRICAHKIFPSTDASFDVLTRSRPDFFLFCAVVEFSFHSSNIYISCVQVTEQ